MANRLILFLPILLFILGGCAVMDVSLRKTPFPGSVATGNLSLITVPECRFGSIPILMLHIQMPHAATEVLMLCSIIWPTPRLWARGLVIPRVPTPRSPAGYLSPAWAWVQRQSWESNRYFHMQQQPPLKAKSPARSLSLSNLP